MTAWRSSKASAADPQLVGLGLALMPLEAEAPMNLLSRGLVGRDAGGGVTTWRTSAAGRLPTLAVVQGPEAHLALQPASPRGGAV